MSVALRSEVPVTRVDTAAIRYPASMNSEQ
jgi:hypothetical protein